MSEACRGILSLTTRDLLTANMRLRFSNRQIEDVIVIDCYGHLVFGEESTELRARVKDLIASSPKIVLNLKDLTFIDSNGTGTLVGLFTSARNAGGELKLAGLSRRIRDVLHIVKLNSVFEVYDDEYAAVASFRVQRASGAQ